MQAYLGPFLKFPGALNLRRDKVSPHLVSGGHPALLLDPPVDDVPDVGDAVLARRVGRGRGGDPEHAVGDAAVQKYLSLYRGRTSLIYSASLN